MYPNYNYNNINYHRALTGNSDNLYYPNNYIREMGCNNCTSNMAETSDIREMRAPYQGQSTNDYNYSNMNVNTMQMKNSLLKNKYPTIYYEINGIIDKIISNYRRTNITDELLEEIVDDIYNQYIERIGNTENNSNGVNNSSNGSGSNNNASSTSNSNNSNSNNNQAGKLGNSNNSSISNRNNNLPDDYKENNSIDNNKNNGNNVNSCNSNINCKSTLKDLIKILFLTRMIKYNLDYVCSNNNINGNINNNYQNPNYSNYPSYPNNYNSGNYFNNSYANGYNTYNGCNGYNSYNNGYYNQNDFNNMINNNDMNMNMNMNANNYNDYMRRGSLENNPMYMGYVPRNNF